MEPRLENPQMDGRRVLVLDAGYRPIGVWPWQEAFTKLYSDSKAKVVEYSQDGAVIGVRRDIRVPAVIQLGAIVRPHKQRIRFCRRNVLVGRDKCICQYCYRQFFTEELTLDHVVPRSAGGVTSWENIVACCIPCNQRKANRTPQQAGMKLMRRPTIPKHLLESHVAMDITKMPPEWRDYWEYALLK